MSDWADASSPLAIPTFGGLGSGLYDFGYTTQNLPPSGAAQTATQLESGGSGFDWGKGLVDLAGLWLQTESAKDVAQAQMPVQYRMNSQGQMYLTDPAYRPAPVLGIPTWMLIGGAVLAVVLLTKD